MVRQDAVGYAADERGLAVLPFAVLLGDAGLGYAEVDDGLAACRALGFEIGDEIAHEVMGIWLIVAMIGPFFRIAAHVVGLSFSLHRMSIFHVPTQSHACSLNLACCWAVYGFSRRVEHSAREVFRPACVYEA